jgi:hypothetical protein
MRLLRRRVQIITLGALLVAPIATAQAGSADDARQPWATVNICDTTASPDTIGIRASMPGSRTGAEVRWMRFVVEYYSEPDARWLRLDGGDSGFLRVGKGRTARQFGRSVRIDPGGEPVLLRGRVHFQWRTDGGDVVQRASARTHKGHRSNTGDDPPGYSASTCTIRPG